MERRVFRTASLYSITNLIEYISNLNTFTLRDIKTIKMTSAYIHLKYLCDIGVIKKVGENMTLVRNNFIIYGCYEIKYFRFKNGVLEVITKKTHDDLYDDIVFLKKTFENAKRPLMVSEMPYKKTKKYIYVSLNTLCKANVMGKKHLNFPVKMRSYYFKEGASIIFYASCGKVNVIVNDMYDIDIKVAKYENRIG